jgi:hypothetical protein
MKPMIILNILEPVLMESFLGQYKQEILGIEFVFIKWSSIPIDVMNLTLCTKSETMKKIKILV